MTIYSLDVLLSQFGTSLLFHVSGSLSLLQGIFPTQESNQGLLHCRWILYQLSYQGSPDICIDISSHNVIYNIAIKLGKNEKRKMLPYVDFIEDVLVHIFKNSLFFLNGMIGLR